eukprot:11943811-Heterocapsa_arctica.AAC.1
MSVRVDIAQLDRSMTNTTKDSMAYCINMRRKMAHDSLALTCLAHNSTLSSCLTNVQIMRCSFKNTGDYRKNFTHGRH